MNRIVWLASYPKSGNTWFRIFLANYTRDTGKAESINGLFFISIASGRQHFDEILAVDASDFSADEYDCLRPDVYRGMASRAVETIYLKVHDANAATPSGEPLLPPEATARAIYFARDPRDVAVSFAHHMHAPASEAIERMNDAGHEFCSAVRGLDRQLRQRVSTWSGHVASWIDETAFPVHVMRYEDMVARPEQTFADAVRFLGLPLEADRLERALRFSSFDEVQRQEADGGFCEAPANVDRFFREGRVGAWTEHLSAEEASRVESDHKQMMLRLGYLEQVEEVSDPVSVSHVRD